MVLPRRHELTDEEWALLAPLLPPPPGHGRPYQDHRRILNGILFVLHTGVPWRDLPEHYYLAMLYVGLIERYLSTLFANTA